MIVKSRQKSLKTLKLEALLRRLPPNHPKRIEIENELAKCLAGFKGEQSLNYLLSFLPEQDYYILHDLRLKGAKHYFQMDTLILPPNFFLIIEAKNIAGTIHYDPIFHQLIRVSNDKEDVFSDPLVQVQHQQFQLKEWLSARKYSSIPLESIVVFTHSTCIIKMHSGHPDLIKGVIRGPNLLNKIHSFQNMHSTIRMTTKELRKLSTLLIKNDCPHNPDILSSFQIDKAKILLGVSCPNCHSYSMIWKSGKWCCPICLNKSADAHKYALRDYALLFDESLSTMQVKEFLQLPSISIASKLIISLDLPFKGITKDRKYFLSPYIKD